MKDRAQLIAALEAEGCFHAILICRGRRLIMYADGSINELEGALAKMMAGAAVPRPKPAPR